MKHKRLAYIQDSTAEKHVVFPKYNGIQPLLEFYSDDDIIDNILPGRRLKYGT